MIPAHLRTACAAFALLLFAGCEAKTNDDSNFIVLTVRTSIDAASAQATGPSQDPDITPDGRYVVFSSRAPDLVSGDANGRADIFRKNLVTGEVIRVSVEDPTNPDGIADGDNSNGDSFNPAVSADGLFVAFESNATDLVQDLDLGDLEPGDTNGTTDIYLRDIAGGVTIRVSIEHSSDLDGDGDPNRNSNSFSLSPDISADGRFVVFDSFAEDLVPADWNDGFSQRDVFAFDSLLGIMARISTSTTGVVGDEFNTGHTPAISGDGQIIAFVSESDDLLDGGLDTNGGSDIYVRQWLSVTPVTERVSVPDGGTSADNGTVPNTSFLFSTSPGLSHDGRFVAFACSADNLVLLDNNGAPDAFVRDRTLGTTTRASINVRGTEVLNGVDNAVISADGRFVAFESSSPDVVLDDTNNASDVFVRDLVAGTTVRVSVATYGRETPPFFSSFNVALSGDGRFAAFSSAAPNLTANDTNGVTDVFVRGPLY